MRKPSVWLALVCLTSTVLTHPVQAARRPGEHGAWTIGAEGGYDGLPGTIGVFSSYNPHQQFSLDAALGFARDGVRFGLRPRYNILTGPHTIFVGLAPLLNIDNHALNLPYAPVITEHSHPVGFSLQGVVGYGYYSPSGFTVLASLGWVQAFVLTAGAYQNQYLDNLFAEYNGQPQKDPVQATSGVSASVMVGYTF